jgi:hypothetical protein
MNYRTISDGTVLKAAFAVAALGFIGIGILIGCLS